MRYTDETTHIEAAHGNVVRSKLTYIIIVHLDINRYLTLLTGIRKKIPKKKKFFHIDFFYKH